MSTRGEPLQMQLERDVNAPGRARAAVSGRLEEAGIDGSLEQTIVLLVSELVSNAVRHSTGPADAPIGFQAEVDDERVRVVVTDAGSGFMPRPRDPERLGEGYGLFLLEKAASRWGVESGSATTVWFELERAS